MTQTIKQLEGNIFRDILAVVLTINAAFFIVMLFFVNIMIDDAMQDVPKRICHNETESYLSLQCSDGLHNYIQICSNKDFGCYDDAMKLYRATPEFCKLESGEKNKEVCEIE